MFNRYFTNKLDKQLVQPPSTHSQSYPLFIKTQDFLLLLCDVLCISTNLFHIKTALLPSNLFLIFCFLENVLPVTRDRHDLSALVEFSKTVIQELLSVAGAVMNVMSLFFISHSHPTCLWLHPPPTVCVLTVCLTLTGLPLVSLLLLTDEFRVFGEWTPCHSSSFFFF